MHRARSWRVESSSSAAAALCVHSTSRGDLHSAPLLRVRPRSRAPRRATSRNEFHEEEAPAGSRGRPPRREAQEGQIAEAAALRALGRRTRLLQLRRAVDKDRFKTAEEETYLESLSRDMLARPCSGCGATCGCGDEKYLSSQLGGESVYTGLIATSDGLYKEHDDSERACAADEREFEGLADFAAASRLADVYLGLANKSRAEREAIAGERAARFATRFAPEALLRRAGVDAMLRDLIARTSQKT